MTLRITISKDRVNERYSGNVVLEGEVFAYGMHEGKPCYIVYMDTSEYDFLWRETVKEFKSTDNWREKLSEKYIQDPELEERLSDYAKFKVPGSLLAISHKRKSPHGDLTLIFKDGDVDFNPLSAYETFLKDKTEYLMWVQVLYDRDHFKVGNEKSLRHIGVEIEKKL